jgi:SNF2 family DNA or RNA helicase
LCLDVAGVQESESYKSFYAGWERNINFSLANLSIKSYFFFMEFIGEPAPYQKELVELSTKIPNVGLLWDAGVGKTYAVIHALRFQYNLNFRVMKTIIFSPIVTLWNWKAEFDKFSKIGTLVHVIDKKGAKRIEQLSVASKQNCVIVLNWEALRTEAIFNIIMEFAPEIVVGDEMHILKNYKSSTAKLAVKITDDVRKRNGRVFGMTGTAILNSIQDIYMQYRFLDGGKSFGTNFFTFRNLYMVDLNANWRGQKKFPDWKPRPEMFPELNKKIYAISTKVSKKEALPFLPDLVEINRYVELSAEQSKLYNEMKRDYITWINANSVAVAQLALTKLLRLQQIVCGHINDEYGEVHYIKDNPRLGALEDLLISLVDQHKVIVWHTFKADSTLICRMLDQNKIHYVTINGDQDITAKQRAMDEFNKLESCRVLVGNRRAGGIGINLIAADYSIVYSRNFSLGEEEQSKARNYRRGSEIHDKIIKIDLISKGTIDETLAEALKNKSDIAGIILRQFKE